MKIYSLLACIIFLASCSTDTKKYSETIGKGDDAVHVRYQKPKTDINLPKTAIISCDSECRNSITQVYEFEHVESSADEASCKYKFSVPCYPFSCDAKKYSCGTSCSAHQDCAARAICDFETKQCVPAITSEEIAESKAAQRSVSAKKIAIPEQNSILGASKVPMVDASPSATPAAIPTASPTPSVKKAVVKVKPTPEPDVDAIPAPALYSGKLSPEGKE